ncbi:MAG: NADH-quinone oxidoreductase subunit NuoH [Planctomycetes bacterium]|nr:NADH-quinone oxidoreductase subunit NuoH [Planctomycetota bacterium]
MNDFAAKVGLTGEQLEHLLAILVRNTVILIGIISVAAVMTLVERKVSAWMQFRHGPNRVGPWGLLQPLADGVKFIFKEVVVPNGANKALYVLAPALAAVPAMMTIAVIPFANDVVLFGKNWGPLVVADIDIGILYLLAIGSMSVYGVILAGWASNSKYSLLGGLRASAQMISYELSMILAILAVVAMAGSINLREIVESQAHGGSIADWNFWKQPLACFLLLVASFAETNRHPFDFAECEPELVAGFNTEYSAMKWAIFFIGEYSAMAVMSSLSVILFFGGWSIPFLPDAPWYLGFAAFLAKTSVYLFLFVWVRWTLPRFRFDQLMRIGWKVMLPLALVNLLATGAWLTFFGPPGAP